ncbi:MAG: ASCH domain-containing protein [Pseudomonadota bacterium]
MLALSVVAPSGTNIESGKKTIEVRSWRPAIVPLRNLLIVENAVFLGPDQPCDPHGRAVALVDVEEVHAWLPAELEVACASGWLPGYWAWRLSNVRPVCWPADLTARLGIYELQLPGLLPLK